jgi:hypothetical protein
LGARALDWRFIAFSLNENVSMLVDSASFTVGKSTAGDFTFFTPHKAPTTSLSPQSRT